MQQSLEEGQGAKTPGKARHDASEVEHPRPWVDGEDEEVGSTEERQGSLQQFV